MRWYAPPNGPHDLGVAVAPQSVHPLVWYRRLAIAVFYVATVLDALLDTLHATPVHRIPAIFAMASAATMCCIVDASMRGGYYLHSFRWMTMITWPIALPIYLVWSRRTKGIWLTLVFGLLFAVALALGSALGNALRV